MEEQEKLTPVILNDVLGDTSRLAQLSQELHTNYHHRRDQTYQSIRYMRYQVDMLKSRLDMLDQAYSRDL